MPNGRPGGVIRSSQLARIIHEGLIPGETKAASESYKVQSPGHTVMISRLAYLSDRETSQVRRLRLLENRRSADVALFLLPGRRYNYQDQKPIMALQHCAHIDLRLVLEATEAAAG